MAAITKNATTPPKIAIVRRPARTILPPMSKSKAKSKENTSKAPNARYTPPSPSRLPPSPMWVPAAMFTLLLGGVLVIMLNYMNLLPGDADNKYLFAGLGMITLGFGFATRYR